MDTDLALVLGILAGGLAFLSLVSAFSESRPPRMALLLAVVATGLLYYALTQNVTGYGIGDVPAAFLRVIGRLFN